MLLITNRQKRKFAIKILKSYEDIYATVGRKIPTHLKVEYRRKLFKLLKIKRSKSLEY